MILYRAVIDNADYEQLLAIKDRLADLEQQVDEILPMSQFNAFLLPTNDNEHPREVDIWVAIEGDLTRPQLSSLKQAVGSTTAKTSTAPLANPRIVEKLIRL